MPSVLAMGDTLVEVSMQVTDAWEDSPDMQASSCMVGAGGPLNAGAKDASLAKGCGMAEMSHRHVHVLLVPSFLRGTLQFRE